MHFPGQPWVFASIEWFKLSPDHFGLAGLDTNFETSIAWIVNTEPIGDVSKPDM